MRKILGVGAMVVFCWLTPKIVTAEPASVVLWDSGGFEVPWGPEVTADPSWMRIKSSLAFDGEWYLNAVGVTDPGGDNLTILVSTEGYQSLALEGFYRIHGAFEASDYLGFQSSPDDGITWNEFFVLTDEPIGEWKPFSAPIIPDDGEDNENFAFRLALRADSGSDRALFDNLVLSGVAVPEPGTLLMAVLGLAAARAGRRKIWTG